MSRPWNDELVITGQVCPYCGQRTDVEHQSLVYGDKKFGIDKGLIRICLPCDAYTSCDKFGKTRASLAKKELRQIRIKTHNVFDKIWRKGLMTRSEAYKWLCDRMGIEDKYCHIGFFDEYKCYRVIEHSESFLIENQKLFDR